MAFLRPLTVERSFRKKGLFFTAAVAVVFATAAGLAEVNRAQARETTPAAEVVSLATLPAEARQTERLIRSGGPFSSSKDGTVFGNRERLLPRQPRGYYREYTVRTPGSHDRGARRIVCGGSQVTQPEACFYTEDHYASFRRIAP